MNANTFSQMAYENKSNWTLGENKPNSNPIKPNFRKAKMNVNLYFIEDYRKKDDFAVRKNKPNSNPISVKPKMSTNVFVTKDYENETAFRLQKNKPKQTQFQTRCTLCEFFLFFTFLCPGYNLAMQTWTIQKLLNWVTEYLTGKGIDSPRLSAELLLSQVLGLKRIELYTQFDKPVAKQQLDILHDLVNRAGQNEPIAYLVGKTEFYSLELNVTPDCMIPRPETELLVERAIEFLRTRPVRNSTVGNTLQKGRISNGARPGTQFVCDLCTGCGCIAVAIAKNFSNARIVATDICDAALAVAAGNIEKHQLKERVTLLCGDLFDPIISGLDVDKLDLVVCNPPYVSTAEYEKLDKNVKDYEPKVALFAGVDGLDVYRRIIEKADQFLKPDAALMLEIGYAQGPAIKEMLEKTGAFIEIKIEKDLHDNDRIAIAKKQKRLDIEKL
ncbi:MAG: peptide chain release factor N(5)-glutamine methyltransferase [Phycisphaerae bacterium]